MAEAHIDPMSSSSSAAAGGSDSAAGWYHTEIVSYHCCHYQTAVCSL